MKFILGVLSAMVLVAGGCSNERAGARNDGKPASVDGGAARGADQVLKMIVQEPSGFDVVKSNAAHEMTLLSLIHEPLVHVNPDTSDIVPGLASSWRASADQRTWTFELRDDAATPAGEPFSSDDVIFSIELFGRSDFNSPRRPSLLVGTELLKVTAPNERTVVFEATGAAPFLPWSLADLPILERSRFERHAVSLATWTLAMSNTAKVDVLAGYGPFYIISRDAKRIVLRANPNFWGRAADASKLPRLDEIELTIVSDPAIAGTRFASDDAYPARLVAPTERPAYEGRSGFKIRELGPDESTMFFWVNQNPNAQGVDPEKTRIFQSVNFRRGIAHALDRDEVVRRAFLGNARPLYGPISPAFPWAAPDGIDLKALTPDGPRIDHARELIASVDGVTWHEETQTFSYRNRTGKDVPLGFVLYTTPSPGDLRRLAAETVAEQLKAVGLSVTPRVEAFEVVVNRIDVTFDYEACLMFLESSSHAAAMRGVFHSTSGMHFFHPYQRAATGWEADVDAAYDAYVSTGDEGHLARVLRLWTENQPIFYLATANKALVVRDGWTVQGHAATGRSREPMLDRPFIERLVVTRESGE